MWSIVPPIPATGHSPIYPISIITCTHTHISPKVLLVSDSFQSFFKQGRKKTMCVCVCTLVKNINNGLKINRLNINSDRKNFEEYKENINTR